MGVGIVAFDCEIFDTEPKDIAHIRVDLQAGQGAQIAGKLALRLFDVVGIEVAVATGPYEVARGIAADLGDHVSQQGIGGNVERHPEEYIGTPLIQLTTEPAARHVELEQGVTGGQFHLGNVRGIPGGYDVAAGIRILFQTLDQLGDLVHFASSLGRPVTPLVPVYRPEIALGVGPFVPYGYAIVLEVADIGVPLEEPEQLVEDGAGMQLLGGEQGEARSQVETHLPAEDGTGTSTGAVALYVAMLQHVGHEFKILLHEDWIPLRIIGLILVDPELSMPSPAHADFSDLAALSWARGLPVAEREGHLLWVLPAGKKLPADLPARVQWQAALRRRDVKVEDLAVTAQALDLPAGGRMVLVMVPEKGCFERLTTLRSAVSLLLEETPAEVAVVVQAGLDAAQEALYCLWLNGTALPTSKRKLARRLDTIRYYGPGGAEDFAPAQASARANALTRCLTALPPNVLTPTDYRRRIRGLASRFGWKREEYDFRRLKKMGAGAFCAVAQGSSRDDDGGGAAIVHLTHRPPGARLRVALVGKGICFDTGGHNLKPARYMLGMHEDMNGSAVVLGLLQAITELGLPIAVDAWLAIAHNHLAPDAFKQNDIVTALDGTTIEVVHTDAEGRMVLADALLLASAGKRREAPELILDFATLTGSMHTALGTRYSGIFASSDEWAAAAVRAGRESGERVIAFPLDEDYEKALESKVADIKQCTMEGEADHILAARFLKRFTHGRPWIHMDLSASSCDGGLGAAASRLTGFGVAWGIRLLTDRIT